MHASGVLAAAALVGAAQAAPAPFCIWPFCGTPDPSSTPCTTSTTVKSTSTSSSVKVTSTSTSCTTTSKSTSVPVVSTSSSSSSAAPKTTFSSSSSILSSSTSSSSSVITTSAPVTTSSSSSSVVLTTSSSTTSSAAPVATVVASDDGYNFVACAVEPFENGVSGGRALTDDHFASSNMTIDLCVDYCSSLSYTFAGTEYADECYCGNSIAAGTTADTTGRCNMACAGDNTELCGGPGGLQLYEIVGGASVSLPTTYTATTSASGTVATGSGSATATVSAVPTPVASAGGYSYAGCAVEAYANGVNYRSLTDDSTASPNMTVEYCASYCSSFTYFGVEYGDECYCGNTIANGTTSDVAGEGCNFPCAANSAEECGGSAHFNLYSNSGVPVNLPLTYAAATTSTTVSVPTSTVASSTSSSVVASTTSSSSATSTSSASKVSTSSSSVITSSSTSVKPSSTSCSTTSSSVTKTSSAVTGPTPPTTCAPKSTDMSLCPTQQLSSPFGVVKATKYYEGSGYTLAQSSPSNILSWMFPAKTITLPSTLTMCSAAMQCMSQASLMQTLYHSFDLHYRTDSCMWECVISQGQNTQPSYFNVPNPNVSHGCGFSGGLL